MRVLAGVLSCAPLLPAQRDFRDKARMQDALPGSVWRALGFEVSGKPVARRVTENGKDECWYLATEVYINKPQRRVKRYTAAPRLRAGERSYR